MAVNKPLLLAVLLFLCGCDSDDSRLLQFRVKNDAGGTISNFWLGAGPRGGASQNTNFRRINNNSVSRYRSVEALLANYRKCNFVVDSKRYNVNMYPADAVGLQPGHYTLVARTSNGAGSVEFVRE